MAQAHCSRMGGRGLQVEGVSGDPTGAGGNVAVQPAGRHFAGNHLAFICGLCVHQAGVLQLLYRELKATAL